MTRDEARFKLIEGTDGKCTERFMDDFLDSAVAIGILKLDEPKSALQKFEEAAIRKHYWLPADDHASILYDVRELLRDYGLKIVEA